MQFNFVIIAYNLLEYTYLNCIQTKCTYMYIVSTCCSLKNVDSCVVET